MDCFVPLMEEFHEVYGAYPKYPVQMQDMDLSTITSIASSTVWKSI